MIIVRKGLCCFLTFICGIALAQERQGSSTDVIDSLNASALNEANSYHLDEAELLTTRALELSQQANFTKGIADAEYTLGKTLSGKNEYTLALQHLEKSSELYLKISDYTGEIKTFNERGDIYWAIGEYNKYLELHLKSLALSEENNYTPGIIDANISLASTYFILNDFQQAKAYLQCAAGSAQREHDSNRLATINNELGKVYKKQGNYDSARLYLDRSLACALAVKDPDAQARAVHSIGELLYQQGEYKMALEEYKKALAIIKKIDNSRGEAFIYNSLGLVYFRLKNYNEAIKNLEKGVALAGNNGMVTNELQAAEALSQIYSLQGNFKEAFHYHQYFKALNDSIVKKSRIGELARLEMQYRFDKEQREVSFQREQENLLNMARLEKQKSWMYLLFGIIVLLFITSIFIYIYQRLKQRTIKQLLKQRQHKIDKLNREMEELIYRTSHDLRAPVATILGITHLASKTASEDQILYFKMIEDTVHRQEKVIKDIADISKNDHLKLTREEIRFQDIVGEAAKTYVNGYDGIDLQAHYQIEKPFFSDRERIKLIVNNLLSNAVLYRDLHKEKQRIKVSVVASNGSCTLTVQDNGIGIDRSFQNRVYDMFFRGEESSRGAGLGLYVAKNVVERLGGTITFESEKEVGTLFKVQIPNLK